MTDRCPHCGRAPQGTLIYVLGHPQCPHCHRPLPQPARPDEGIRWESEAGDIACPECHVLRRKLAQARKENARLRELIVTAAYNLLHGEPDVAGLLSSELTKDEIRQVMEADHE